MSEYNFTQSLRLTINFWQENGMWNNNELILKKFLTLCSPPPNISKQRILLNNIKNYHHKDLLLSLDDIDSLLSIIKNTSHIKITLADYNDGVDYPIYFGINKIINTKYHLGREFLTRFISEFINTTYSTLKSINYANSDRKIYKAILATREITIKSIVDSMKFGEKLSDKKNNFDNEIRIYREYLNDASRSTKHGFWIVFDYSPSEKKGSTPENNKKRTTSRNKKKIETPSEEHVPRLIISKKKQWTTAKKEIESVFDYSSLSINSILEFIKFVDEKQPSLKNLLILCFLTGLTLKKALTAIRSSSDSKTLNVFISNTPTDSDLCSVIELKISCKSMLHLNDKQLTIKQLVDKISDKFSYLTRKFSESNGGNTMHFDRIASNSNRLLTPNIDDIRIHYLRGKIGFFMNAAFSYISVKNEDIGTLYKDRFANLVRHFKDNNLELFQDLEWDSTLAQQSLGSQRLPEISVKLFFANIRNKCQKVHNKFIKSKSDQLRIDLLNLQEIYVYFLEQLLFSNRPDGIKTISIISDIFIRKDKNSSDYIEYKAIPIPHLYIKQKQLLNQLRVDIHRHFNCHYEINEHTSCMLHDIKKERYQPNYHAFNRNILDTLNSFGIEALSDSKNALRHHSGNALRHDPTTSRALLGHNEDGFYYSSPTSSSNISSNHQDILEYQSSLIKEFDLEVLYFDFN